ncbi:semaphorin-5B-like isoform X2 [Actinia tenebrosa]|nr:semaphorin-5B-like isoform X2 [Actinia tenebrosa]
MVFFGCVQNKALSGHVIKTLQVSPSTATCPQMCFMEANCMSYNMGPIEGETRSCDLNDADNVLDYLDVVAKDGFEFCTFKNPCSSSPCAAGKVCLPDASWNSFNCSNGRWSQWTSWSSCVCDQTRTRQCVDPFTQQTATDCSGSYEEKRNCKAAGTNTTDGTLCVFPFLYKEVWYNHCTCVDWNHPWCATTQIYDKYAWGNCVN